MKKLKKRKNIFVVHNKVANNKYMLRKISLNLSYSNKQKVPFIMRERIWNHYIGPSKGETECLCCETNIITPFRFECAHVVSESSGGNSNLENFRPCCSYCNRSMGTQNFFVFKALIDGKLHIDKTIKNKKYIDYIISQHIFNSNSYSKNQKNIFQFYDQIHKNITCKCYSLYFREWFYILKENLDYEKISKKNTGEKINRFTCKCTYSFDYVTYDNDFELTCRNSKQNLVDVIYDHRLCLIRKKKFVLDTLESKSYKKWLENNKKIIK
jgi:hypothetical protein